MSLILNLGLDNEDLYQDCEMTEVGGRLTLTTPVQEASNLVGRNVTQLVEDLALEERNEITLSGPMAVWAYLIVFHVIVHRFRKVYYEDGRNERILIAQH